MLSLLSPSTKGRYMAKTSHHVDYWCALWSCGVASYLLSLNISRWLRLKCSEWAFYLVLMRPFWYVNFLFTGLFKELSMAADYWRHTSSCCRINLGIIKAVNAWLLFFLIHEKGDGWLALQQAGSSKLKFNMIMKWQLLLVINWYHLYVAPFSTLCAKLISMKE